MKKFNKKEIIALSVIGVLIIAVIVAGVIIITGNVNEANKIATSNTTAETQAVTEIVTDAEGNTQIVEVTQAEKETSETVKVFKPENDTEEPNTTTATSATKATNPKATTATKATEKKDDKDFDNNTSGDTGKVDVVKPSTKPVDKDEEILTINGVKCNVGNTITVTLNAKVPVALENYQGFTEYDDSFLEFVSVKGNVSGMFNNHESVIYYNGSDIGAGYDFTNNGTLYTATFKVLKAGSTKISNTIEVMSDKNSKPVDQTTCEYSIGIFN